MGAGAFGKGSSVLVKGNIIANTVASSYAPCTGVMVLESGKVTITGNVTSTTSDGGRGIHVQDEGSSASIGSNVVVNAPASSDAIGIWASYKTIVDVKGSVSINTAGNVGVSCYDSKVTIGEFLKVPAAAAYVTFAGVDKMSTEHEAVSSKSGYREYKRDSSYVWIMETNLSKVDVTIADMVWTGKKRTPTVFILNGKSYPISGNATVSSSGANKNIGTGTITLTGIGNFEGTRTIKFKIAPKTTKVAKIVAGKKQMKISWKKTAKAQKISKYQVRYRVKGTSKWTTKTVDASKSSLLIKSLKAGKSYQVQIRSYKTVSKVKYYSDWSATKTSAKIKK